MNVDVSVELGENGRAESASATSRVDVPVARMWRLVNDVERYPGRIPMVHKVRLDGDRMTMGLRFKIALFAINFEFVLDVHRVEERSIELRWVSGEPRGIRLRYDLEPVDEGRATNVRGTATFDAMALGWLAKMFLKHHPEIEYGIVPGVAIGLVEGMRQAAIAGR